MAYSHLLQNIKNSSYQRLISELLTLATLMPAGVNTQTKTQSENAPASTQSENAVASIDQMIKEGTALLDGMQGLFDPAPESEPTNPSNETDTAAENAPASIDTMIKEGAALWGNVQGIFDPAVDPERAKTANEENLQQVKHDVEEKVVRQKVNNVKKNISTKVEEFQQTKLYQKTDTALKRIDQYGPVIIKELVGKSGPELKQSLFPVKYNYPSLEQLTEANTQKMEGYALDKSTQKQAQSFYTELVTFAKKEIQQSPEKKVDTNTIMAFILNHLTEQAKVDKNMDSVVFLNELSQLTEKGGQKTTCYFIRSMQNNLLHFRSLAGLANDNASYDSYLLKAAGKYITDVHFFKKAKNQPTRLTKEEVAIHGTIYSQKLGQHTLDKVKKTEFPAEYSNLFAGKCVKLVLDAIRQIESGKSEKTIAPAPNKKNNRVKNGEKSTPDNTKTSAVPDLSRYIAATQGRGGRS